ncbi:MAG TPA: phosphatase PAP2 family protein [Parafilimonas sp.]|nr:phosphatase PAP2 family protein [Parafilimonas sp.]
MEKAKKYVLELISIKVLLVSILFIFCLFGFAYIADEAVFENENRFDNSVFSFFASFSTPGLVSVMKVFTFFGSVQFLVPAYILLIGYFFMKKKYRYGTDIAIIGITSSAMMFWLKDLFHRERPMLPIIQGLSTYSFPSGHALSSFILCSIFIFIIRNGHWKSLYKWIVGILLLLFAITIGVSRIVLKVHYPTDVVASLCLGIAWVIFSLWLLKKINRKYMIRKDLSAAKPPM